MRYIHRLGKPMGLHLLVVNGQLMGSKILSFDSLNYHVLMQQS